ncbi:MAG: type I methionyl aminopeptidase [Propionibacteriaceae bacterium]|nr:type I methionyl aminopeptidase [Propionibacteriaceae bacterium]
MIRGGRGIELKGPDDFRAMRRAGLVVERALTRTIAAAAPGTTTQELNDVAAEVIASAGATPSFLNYGASPGQPGFPAVVCISVNEEIVHGIPGNRVLADGDLVSIDCGAIIDGWHGDSARTFFVGDPAPEHAELSRVTQESLWQGIAAVRRGGRVRDIGAAIDDYVSQQDHEYGIVTEFVGHGIGSAMHQVPDVPNYRHAGRSPKIVVGMALAIEPMLTLGNPENVTLDDDWTVVTSDGSAAAHWEHTVAITEHGLWVLTAPDGGEQMLARLGVPFGPLAD